MNPPDLSIALINWNALEFTSAAIASIQEKTVGITFEVFVVDNGTTKDDSVKALPARFPWITIIPNSTNQGFTKANNQAIRRAQGRYVLLLNNDTIQTGNALGEAVKYMDAHPDLGALGILHLNADEQRTHQASHFPFPHPWLEVRVLLGQRHDTPSRDTATMTAQPVEIDVDWVVGSFLLMRRECLEQVGELDERYFIYDEDVDWCYRARQAGWKVRFWSGTSMVHVGSAAKPFMKDKTFIHFRSHLSYFYKHHGFLAAASYYLAMGMRLTRATAWHLLRLASGKGGASEFVERLRRQFQFMVLRSGRHGG